jgi:hypothetical protein
MTITRTYANVDLTSTGDYISKDSTTDGALKKLDAEIDCIYTALNSSTNNNYGTSEPSAPQAGQLWYDQSAGYLKVYSGSAWSAVASAAGISNIVEDTTPQLGGILDCNEFPIKFTKALASDHTWSGITITATAHENVTIGQVCVMNSDGEFYLADADAEATAKGMCAMATASISADAAGVFLLYGFMRDDTWDWTVGGELYINTTGGIPTQTAPSGDEDIKRIIGLAVSADILFFIPSQTYVELEV